MKQTKMLPQSIKVCGFDPSLRNWGIAVGNYDTQTKKISIDHVAVTNPELSKSKQVRQNSLDLEASLQLYNGMLNVLEGVQAIFVEVPVGSQSARAMASYGICVGLLGALRANGIPFFEVTPTEVKMAGAGKKTATKQDMIEWAVNKHPQANWPTYKKDGVIHITEAKAEHQADAVGAIYAGIKGNTFQQMLPFLVAKQ